MRLVNFVSAVALASAAILVTPDAMAQRNRGQAASVVVIDVNRVANDSALGRDMAAKLQQIQSQINTEAQALAPEQQSLEQEGQRLQRARGNLSDEQVRNHASLGPQFQQYAQRLRQFEVRRATLRGDMECSQGMALRDFSNIVNPIIQSVMRARGAGVVIGATSVQYVAPENDITSTVVQQLDQNAATRALNVTRHPVAECLPQQQQAQPPATGQ